jgi:hypothetical protein
MANRRVFYALEQVAFKPNASGATNSVAPLHARTYASGILAPLPVDEVAGLWEVPRGVQSVAVTTNFNREETFQLGQVELYEYAERQPDVEATLEKIIDGTKPLWLMSTDPQFANLVGRTAFYRTDIALNIYADTQFRANQNDPLTALTLSGMYLSAATYTFQVDGPVTESLTFVGNDKAWANFDATLSGETVSSYPPSLVAPIDRNAPAGLPSGVFGHEDQDGRSELAGGTTGFGVLIVGSGVQRREEVELRRTVLPSDIPGVTAVVGSGVDANTLERGGLITSASSGVTTSQLVATSNVDNIVEHIQTITCSVDLGRDDIFELGSKRPFTKFVDFPVEVTCSIEVITSQGDLIDARSDQDCGPDNTVSNNTIIIRTCDGLQVDLGDQNVIASVDVGGGEAGGGNMTVTYNYTSFNTWTVTHDRFDPRHRVIVFETGNSKFNVGANAFTNPLIGI